MPEDLQGDPRDQRWLVFPGTVNDKPAMFTVDLAWSDRPPSKNLGVLVDVQLPLREPDEQGYPSRSEREVLEQVEERLAQALAWSNQGVYVGRMVTDGACVCFYYAASGDGALQAAEQALAPFPGYEPHVRARLDEGWEFFADFLKPQRDQLRWGLDAATILELANQGDEHARERTIRHYAYFPTSRARDGFVDWARANGYAIERLSKGDDQDPMPFGVSFTHVGPTTIDALFQRTNAADEASLGAGGSYDGWETTIERD